MEPGNATYYEQMLREEGLSHDEILEALDELVQSGQLDQRMHRVILAALEVACE